MTNAQRQMNGLSLHYYTVPSGNWARKDSATQFTEEQWFGTMRQALRMEELINQHSALMDKQDSSKRIGLIVDEWGTWHDVEPGTKPGFLYQQNTLRDALVAGSTLNIFNNHADRVKMANIAQMVNVLQAMVLTDKAKMLLTPTYHVFEMYAVHHDAKLLPTELQSGTYESGSEKIPQLNISASRDGEGKIHVTLCNLHPRLPTVVACELQGAKAKNISGRILTAADMTAHNTFEQPETVKVAAFSDAKTSGDGFGATLPAKSVVVLELE